MRVLLYSIIAAVILSGCGGKKQNPSPPPTKAILVFPDQNSVCISGTVISNALSTVQFKWNASTNTNSYDLVVKNLITGSTETHNTNQLQLNVDLQRNTPYSWSVTSKSGSLTATSDSWKFYNAGSGVIAYAPFPADNLVPATGQFVDVPAAGKITLSWHGSDTDNDIVSYDVYFGTGSSPAVYQQNVMTATIGDVPVAAKTKYYWKVVTFDSAGNSSASDIVQFNTN